MKQLSVILLLCFTLQTIAMESEKKSLLVLAAWHATQNTNFATEWDEVTIKKARNGVYSIKHLCRPKGMQQTRCEPSGVLAVTWPSEGPLHIAVQPRDDDIQLRIRSWYKHPALTHSFIALTALLVMYAIL